MHEPIAKSASVCASRKQISCHLQGEAVVLHIAQGRYYSLNQTGAAAWQLMQKPCTVRQLLDHLIAEFDVEEDRCTRDLQLLLHELVQADLVEVYD